MSILTIAWSMASAICLTFAVINLYVWIRGRNEVSNLLFFFTALGASIIAILELSLLHTNSLKEFLFLSRMINFPIALLVVSLVWFIVKYFETARVWLAKIITALWSIAVLVNIFLPNGLIYSDVTELKQVSLPWNEKFTIASIAVVNPLKYIADLASLLIIIFLFDASLRLWRRGNKGRVISIGVSTMIFMVLGGIITPLVDEGILKMPYMISFFFLAIIFATGFQLGNDVIRASELSKEIEKNERRWRSLLENVQLLVVGLDTSGNVNYVNPYLLKLTGFDKQDVLGKNWFDYFLPEVSRSELKKLLYEIQEGEFYSHYRNPVITRNNEERLIEWSNVELYDREGNITGTLSIGADITEREKAFEEIKQLKDRLQEENIYLQEEIILDHNYGDIVGRSDALKYALSRVTQVAPTDTTVLLEGETGVGKELFARAVHQNSPRRQRPLVRVNCAAIPVNLIESELFGYIKGAFTGADKDRRGRFEVANNGTIFLDEISELPLEVQSKLLRVLEEGEFERLGSNETIRVNVRIIATTNRNLREEVRKGNFREDLYYRLHTFPISIPPLRKRRDDILPLVEMFVDKFSRKIGKRIKKIPKNAKETLLNYDWPGNVRELRNVIERAVIATTGEKLILPEILRSSVTHHENKEEQTEVIPLEEAERRNIIKALQATSGKISGDDGAAALLKIHPNTLRFRMQKLNIDRRFN